MFIVDKLKGNSPHVVSLEMRDGDVVVKIDNAPLIFLYENNNMIIVDSVLAQFDINLRNFRTRPYKDWS